MEKMSNYPQAIAALKETVVPHLRSLGFKGRLPHLQRCSGDSVDLISIRNTWNTAFVVDYGRVESVQDYIARHKGVDTLEQIRPMSAAGGLRLCGSSPEQKFMVSTSESLAESIERLMGLIESTLIPYWDSGIAEGKNTGNQ